jgi:hypothetical protein
MLIGSPEINKVLRRYLRPVLIENGFDIAEPRKAWGWQPPSIWTVGVRAVGSYFSEVTGWPPMSVSVGVGIYYDFIPFQGNRQPRVDSKGRLRPDIVDCHRTAALPCSLDQSTYKSDLRSPAERTRTDLWWIEESGDNLADVAENIALSVLEHGVSWLKANSDIEQVFAIVETEKDCLIKYRYASYLAGYLGNLEKRNHYETLAVEERLRIDDLFAPYHRRKRVRKPS